MSRSVVLSELAIRDIFNCRQWWSDHRSAEQASRWYAACEKALDALANSAERCSKALESSDLPFDVRERPFGIGRRPTHRVVFAIRPDMIYVLRVRHLSQDQLTADDV